MRIRQVALDYRRQVNRFIDFPFMLYRDNEFWVPPMRSEMCKVLNPAQHPFYHHSEACFLLAESEGSVLGRVAVLNHKRYNTFRRENTAFFYYFDTINDQQVCSQLIEAASQWARDRGLTRIIGPKGFLQADGHGILVEGFEHPPAMGIPYNYDYYESLLVASGFHKVTDYFSGFLTYAQGLPERYYQVARQVQARRGYTIKTFKDRNELRGWIERVGRIYRESFANHWEFCPPTDEEMALIGERIISVADPHLIELVLTGEEVIGFILAFPDISEGLRRAHGKMLPLGWWHLLQAYKHTTHLIFNGVGILDPYQGTGANAVMYAEMARILADKRYQHAEFVQVEERNTKSLGEIRALKIQWYKRHRVYQLSL